MITFFDTETTGLPLDWKAPMSKLDNWPRVIQLAWMVCDYAENILVQKEILIKPDGWVIPDGKFWVDHGFNTELSLEKGVPLQGALDEFVVDLNRSDYLVSHNMDFDHKVLGAEFLRTGTKGNQVKKICTKEASTEYCGLTYGGQRKYYNKLAKNFKWPKLEELHQKLFGKDFENKHQAGGDVLALKNCFFELCRRGVIPLTLATPNP